MSPDDPKRDLAKPVATAELERPGEPPVVARLVVEIRSDGTRTIARGALEDAAAGQRVAIQAEGTTPLQLAVALARTLVQAPFTSGLFSARAVARALLGRRKKDR